MHVVVDNDSKNSANDMGRVLREMTRRGNNCEKKCNKIISLVKGSTCISQMC